MDIRVRGHPPVLSILPRDICKALASPAGIIFRKGVQLNAPRWQLLGLEDSH